MKKLLIFLSFLFCLSVQSQPHCFFRQIDNSIQFGGNLQGLSGADEIRFLKDSLHCNWIRDAVTLETYNGGVDVGLKRNYDSGMRVACNLNYFAGGGACNKNFPRGGQLTTYRNKLVLFIGNNIDYLKNGYIVIENEPFNGQFYNYDACQPFMSIVDYINELSVAIEVCHSFNLKVTDGATHLTYYSDIMNPPISGDAAKRGDSALIRYDTMQLDWVNYHFNVPFNTLSNNSTMNANIIKTLTTFGTSISGHTYISNEWHQEATTDIEQNTMAASIVTRTRQAHIRCALVFGGDGTSNALGLVNNTTLKLTSLGRAYRDAIASGE